MKNCLDLIGKAPLVRLGKLQKALNFKANLYAKLEFLSPFGSVKDTPVYYILSKLFGEGKIDKNTFVVEATSGNTGVALSAICGILGCKCLIFTTDDVLKQKKKLMEFYGAKVVTVPHEKGLSYCNELVQRECRLHENYLPLNQFDSPLNLEAHYSLTAPKIFDDLMGGVDVFVAGVGSGGTLCGVGRFLKEKNNSTLVVGVEPESSPVLTRGWAGRHGIIGIGAGFVPKLFDKKVVDKVIGVDEKMVPRMVRLIAETEGIGVGLSSGAVVLGTTLLLKENDLSGKNVVMMFADGIYPYLDNLL